MEFSFIQFCHFSYLGCPGAGGGGFFTESALNIVVCVCTTVQCGGKFSGGVGGVPYPFMWGLTAGIGGRGLLLPKVKYLTLIYFTLL